jgi:hypothetical protein
MIVEHPQLRGLLKKGRFYVPLLFARTLCERIFLKRGKNIKTGEACSNHHVFPCNVTCGQRGVHCVFCLSKKRGRFLDGYARYLKASPHEINGSLAIFVKFSHISILAQTLKCQSFLLTLGNIKANLEITKVSLKKAESKRAIHPPHSTKPHTLTLFELHAQNVQLAIMGPTVEAGRADDQAATTT